MTRQRLSRVLVASAAVALAIAALVVASGLAASRAMSPSAPRLLTSKAPLLIFSRKNVIYSIRSSGRDLHRLVAGSQPTWSPDGTRLAYARVGTGGDCGDRCELVYVVNADGTHVRPATVAQPPHDIQINPAWSPDGNAIVYSGSSLPPTEFALAVAMLGGAPRFIRGNEPTWDVQAAWSPDASWICFVRAYDGLYVIAPTGVGLRRIASESSSVPAWSPDSRRILFTVAKGVFIVDLAGTHLRLVARLGKSPAWSPDGQRIVYSDRTGILIVRADGTGRTRLTRSQRDQGASWSPDGKALAFERHGDIWLMQADGSRQRRLIRNGTGAIWQPQP